MEITYIGHSCFKIKGSNLTIIVDPYDSKIGYNLPKLEAQVVLTSHSHFDHSNIAGVKNYKLLIDTPGEYEVSGAFVLGLPTYHDEKEGSERGKNTAFYIEIDGFHILHLGDLGHELTDETLEKLDVVDVLMIPVGGHYTIDAETASKVISSIEPSYVIPMHYQTDDLTGVEGLQTLDKFTDAMGMENGIKKLDTLVIKNPSDIPDETEIVILKQSH